MKVTVTGDDEGTILVTGDLDAELLGDDGEFLGFSDGTILKASFDDVEDDDGNQLLRLTKVAEGSSLVEIRCDGDDEQGHHIATLEGDNLRWVMHAFDGNGEGFTS